MQFSNLLLKLSLFYQSILTHATKQKLYSSSTNKTFTINFGFIQDNLVINYHTYSYWFHSTNLEVES